MTRRDLGRDHGSGTVLALGVLGAVALAAMLLAGIAGAVAAHGRAQGVADLAALGAAYQARDVRAMGDWNTSKVCAVASEVAVANSVMLSECVVAITGVVTVAIRVQVPVGSITARASAGNDSPELLRGSLAPPTREPDGGSG